MATITEVTGKSYKILADATAGIWHKISMWTKASDVYNNSNKTLETTCGSITGITSSLTSTSTTMAASASAIKELNDKIADLNSNLDKEIAFDFIMNQSNSSFSAEIGAKYIIVLTGGKFSSVSGGTILYNFNASYNVTHSILFIEATSATVKVSGSFNSVDMLYSKIIE